MVKYGTLDPEQYGKPDMERLGLFMEMPYMNGKGYVSPFPKPKVTKGRNIMGPGSKSKNGTQHGYFDDTFRRLFEGEAIPRPKYRKKDAKQLQPFRPAGFTKWHSCPGDHFGTFAGIIEAFGNERRPKKPYKKEPPNCLTNPGRKGGPGYPDICLSHYPQHLPDPYRRKLKEKEFGVQLGGPLLSVHYPRPYFDENPYLDTKSKKVGPTYVPPKEKSVANVGDGPWVPTGPCKWQGGCHDGCFDLFPGPVKMPKRKSPKKKAKDEDLDNFYVQSMALKRMMTNSVLNQSTDLRINVTNYKTAEPIYTKRLTD